MEISPEAVTPTKVSGCGGSLQQERPRVRRRMVQSTLFPHKSPENATNKVVEIRDQQDGDEDEEYCSSQGKKKRGRKPKAAAKKVALDGRETCSRKVDDKASPVTDKSTLCMKASNGGDQQQDQPLFGSPGNEDEIEASSPLQSTPNMKSRRQPKKQASSTPKKRVRTPKKNTMNGGQKDTYAEKISDPSSQGEAVIQPIPDLRLEEKLKAEEIARVFGGREIHPFFSSCKIAKKTQQQTKDMDMNRCFVDGKDKSSVLGPIHVFEKAQDDAVSLDWGSWVLFERSLVSINCDTGTTSSPVFDRSVNSLSFDDSLNLYPSGGISLFQSEAIRHESVSLDQSLTTMSEISPMLSADDSEAQCNLLKKAQEHCHGHESESANVSCEYPGYLRSRDSEWGDGFLHKRTMASNQGCGDHSENNLWTYRHLPEKANEICGNGESVNFLSEWLQLWHERGFRSSKDLTAGKTFIVEDDDCNSYQSDSDPESRDEDDGLKNVLLLTGPVGSGKSAAIYACAKEQGFHVIEVNASDWRTRSLMMQRFGGGVESHCVQRSGTADTLKLTKEVVLTALDGRDGNRGQRLLK